jgi:hypothetical protein
MAREVIREFDNFVLEYITGVGMNDTPYEELVVKSRGLAEKHVVEVRLDSVHVPFNGAPVKYAYRRVEVSHGMRMRADTLVETQEYINVLKEALDVAFEVQKYCMLNGWWVD